MNKILFHEKIPQNPYFFPLVFLFFSAAILLLADRVLANNAVLRSIFSCQAQGLGGAIPEITVWYKQGTNLSFLPTGETIRKVWLDDPSQVTLDFDGPMCVQFGQQNSGGTGDCDNSAADVIHLRRIKKLDIPDIPSKDSTLLTVVTDSQGRRKLYNFRIVYSQGEPIYNTLAVFPDLPSSGVTPCVRVNQQ